MLLLCHQTSSRHYHDIKSSQSHCYCGALGVAVVAMELQQLYSSSLFIYAMSTHVITKTNWASSSAHFYVVRFPLSDVGIVTHQTLARKSEATARVMTRRVATAAWMMTRRVEHCHPLVNGPGHSHPDVCNLLLTAQVNMSLRSFRMIGWQRHKLWRC